ncbi:hypothetical protein [Flavobacterium defluvii]|uniref:Uncharacterized protein n=1 Tax=Flavobacterium defluvii TaxID=370979 RepID=A0A1M5WNA3_9FLAO|nr:hypothetical protein [Flavobacterium defluvii]SHH89017.1 hypothetical protein SAMN05443663_11512 [Flavobacterium defluvii]
MKKPDFYLIFLIPIIARSTNPNPLVLDNKQAAASHGFNAFYNFTADVIFDSYTIFKMK